MGEAKRRRDHINRQTERRRKMHQLTFGVLAALGGYRGQLAGPPSLSR